MSNVFDTQDYSPKKHDDEEMCQVSVKCLVIWQVYVMTDRCLPWPLNVLAKKLICNTGKENFLFSVMLDCFLDPHLSNLQHTLTGITPH